MISLPEMTRKLRAESLELRAGSAVWRGAGRRPALPLGLALMLALVASARAEETFYAARVAPVLEKNCVVCHGEKKQKGKLRLDSFEQVMRGGEDGAAVKAGDVKGSELFRRITLKHDDEEFMPSDGKPPLTSDEVKVLELWIAAGASDQTPVSAIRGVPALAAPKPPPVALAPDWHPRGAQIAALEKALGLKILPRSALATDGLVLRTASAPSRCDDAALAKLKPIADLIVEAELARTKVTDAGLASLAGYTNLRSLDLTRTPVTTKGLAALQPLKKLEVLNLTATKVDAAGVTALKTALPKLTELWTFNTPATPDERVAAPLEGANDAASDKSEKKDVVVVPTPVVK